MAELFDSHCGAFDCSDPPQHLEQLVQLLRAAYALIHLLRVVVSQNQNMVNDLSAGSVRLFSQPAPAVLTTYRKDGSAATSPVWFRYRRGNVEVVLADGDTKLGQLERDPRCSLTIFETQPPFRGLRIEGAPRLEIDEGNKARLEIASRYLGPDRGRRFVEQRTTPGRILHIETSSISEWDLTTILPSP